MTYFIKSARRRCNHPHTRKKNLQHRPPPAYFSSLIVYTCGYPHTNQGVIVDFVVLYESRAFLVLRIKTTTFIVSEAGKSDPKSLFLS